MSTAFNAVGWGDKKDILVDQTLTPANEVHLIIDKVKIYGFAKGMHCE